jgi:hypothetical protein
MFNPKGELNWRMQVSYLVRPEDIAIYLVEWNYVLWISHIDESIAHITLVLRKADIARVSAWNLTASFNLHIWGKKNNIP